MLLREELVVGRESKQFWLKVLQRLEHCVAFRVMAGFIRGSCTITTCIPAALPAVTPLGASSNTKYFTK